MAHKRSPAPHQRCKCSFQHTATWTTYVCVGTQAKLRDATVPSKSATYKKHKHESHPTRQQLGEAEHQQQATGKRKCTYAVTGLTGKPSSARAAAGSRTSDNGLEPHFSMVSADTHQERQRNNTSTLNWGWCGVVWCGVVKTSTPSLPLVLVPPAPCPLHAPAQPAAAPGTVTVWAWNFGMASAPPESPPKQSSRMRSNVSAPGARPLPFSASTCMVHKTKVTVTVCDSQNGPACPCPAPCSSWRCRTSRSNRHQCQCW